MPTISVAKDSVTMDENNNASVPAHNNTGCPRTLDQFKRTSEIGGLLIPMGDTYWTERDDTYKAFFYIMLIVFGILFLSLAVVCILLLVKRHLAQRFKVRTFIAIDVSLIILGFSRVVFIIIDPWGQSGFCSAEMAGEAGAKICQILSRYSGSLAFPSLTASYTLVFITLWSSAKIQLGRSSYQKYKILIPLCFIHYIVAIVFETIGLIPWPGGSAPIVVISLLIACEAIFSMWGFLVCFGYLFAGHRLLSSIEKSARNSSVICRDSPSLTRHELIEKSKFQNRQKRARTTSNLKLRDMVKEHHRRALRKVSIIMYLTVFLGMLYSALSLLNLILIVLTVYDGCPGYTFDMLPQRPEVWLTIRYLFFTLEFLLALLLTYSIADYRPVLIFLRGVACVCSKSQRVSSSSRKQSPDIALSSGTTTDTPSSPSIVRNGSSTSKSNRVKFDFGEPKSNVLNAKDTLDSKDELYNDEVPQLPPSPTTSHVTMVPTVRVSSEHRPNNPSPLTIVQTASSTSQLNDSS